MPGSHHILINHIEAFIRKYFKNRLYKGLLFFTLLITSVFLIFVFIEYLSYLSPLLRAILFYTYLILFGIVLFGWVAYPLLQLIRYRKSMTLKQASDLIGKHFPEVSDKLLNTLQLQEIVGKTKDEELLLAAIQQRTEKLSKVPFVEAVNFKENLKYVRWTLLPVSILILFMLLSPSFISQPAARIVDYNTLYEKPLPFSVDILTPLYVTQNEDYKLEIALEGEEFPEQFFVETGGMKMMMEREQTNRFSIVFKKVSQEIDFTIQGGPYRSKPLFLEVYQKALLMSFEARLEYPAYTKRSDEFVRDQNWMSVPEGTTIHLQFYTRATDDLIVLNDSVYLEATREDNKWLLSNTAYLSQTLQVIVSNTKSGASAPLSLYIEVVKDEYPVIVVQSIEDQLLSKSKYFTGLIGDDYGFSRLERRIKITNEKEEIIQEYIEKLTFDSKLLRQQFYHFFNLDSLYVDGSKDVSIQFAVYDNDQINGPKVRLSTPFVFSFIGKDVLDSISKSQEDQIQNQLNKAMTDAQEVKKELQEINRNLLQKKELDWNDRQQINEVIKKQQSLESLMEQLKSDQQNLNQFNKENELVNERLLEKQAMIDQLIEEVIPEDIRKMMDELQQLLDELNKDEMADMLKQMEMNSEKMEQMLDRNLALLKQLQFEKKMNDLLDRLAALAEELEENAESTEEEKLSTDELSDKLEDIQSRFEQERRELDKLEKENKELERPFNLDATNEEEQQAVEDMQQGQQQLQNQQNNESSKSQQKAAEKMNQMRSKLQMSMQMNSMQQMAEDAAALRFLLENILRISISQEDALTRLQQMRRDDPSYIEIIREQNIVAESFRVVDDSLKALSMRQPMIQNFVFNEVDDVKRRVGESQDFMKDRQTGNAASSQQFAMMALNNLALMLSEALKNMQESMGMPSPMQGEGQCKDGQSSGQGLQNMREMQEALGNQLKNAMDGKGGKNGQTGMSEEIARMAAQQEAIRNQLKQLMDELKSGGEPGGEGLSEVLEEMEKFEEQLVNKQLNQQLLERQNDIVVRLLESEKAMKEREREERRESNEFEGENFGNLIDELEYKRRVEKQQDQLRNTPIDLQPFYKQKVNQYYLRFNALSTYEKDNFNE